MYKIEMMELKHLPDIISLEEKCFAIPWSARELEKQITENEFAVYFVAVDSDSKVVGYCGMWHILDEGHVTSVAVDIEHRGVGIGNFLIENLITICEEKKITGITLEVRISNIIAQKLYVKFGFRSEGLRKNYYSDTKEDAIIMWKYL